MKPNLFIFKLLYLFDCPHVFVLSYIISHRSQIISLLFLSFSFFFSTLFLLGHFAIQYTQSDLYPVQRLATVARNFVVRTKGSKIDFFLSCDIVFLQLEIIYDLQANIAIKLRRS